MTIVISGYNASAPISGASRNSSLLKVAYFGDNLFSQKIGHFSRLLQYLRRGRRENHVWATISGPIVINATSPAPCGDLRMNWMRPLAGEKQRYGQSPYEHCGFQRVWLEHNVIFKGWNSHVHRVLPGKFESSNVSRDNVSRETGRTAGVSAAQLLVSC